MVSLAALGRRMIAPLTPLRERYDAVLLDLDGTLLDGASALTPRARAAVRMLVDAGLEVSLCTGRSVVGARSQYEELGLRGALVAYNGAWIGCPDESRIWRQASIPDDWVGSIQQAESHAVFSFWHGGGRKYSLARSHPLYARVTQWYTAVEVLNDAGGLPRTSLMRVSWYFDEEAHVDRAWSALGGEAPGVLHRETFPMSVFPEFRDDRLYLCEIQVLSRGKAEAFRWLEGERGIPPERVIAVGDHRNDLSMLEGAGLAVVMGNGVPEAKAHADLVIGRNDEHGLAAWVEAGCPLPGDDEWGERIRGGRS